MEGTQVLLKVSLRGFVVDFGGGHQNGEILHHKAVLRREVRPEIHHHHRSRLRSQEGEHLGQESSSQLLRSQRQSRLRRNQEPFLLGRPSSPACVRLGKQGHFQRSRQVGKHHEKPGSQPQGNSGCAGGQQERLSSQGGGAGRSDRLRQEEGVRVLPLFC